MTVVQPLGLITEPGLHGGSSRRSSGLHHAWSGRLCGYILWYFFSMTTWEIVQANLGDKVVDALVGSIRSTKADLEEYRQVLPQFAYEQSARGLAGWIHDRIWRHVLRGLDDVDQVSFVDNGPTREVYVGTLYKMRFKRHDSAGLIRNYPTPGALALWDAAAEGGATATPIVPSGTPIPPRIDLPQADEQDGTANS